MRSCDTRFSANLKIDSSVLTCFYCDQISGVIPVFFDASIYFAIDESINMSSPRPNGSVLLSGLDRWNMSKASLVASVNGSNCMPIYSFTSYSVVLFIVLCLSWAFRLQMFSSISEAQFGKVSQQSQ